MSDLRGWIIQQINEAQQRADRWHDTECAVATSSVLSASR